MKLTVQDLINAAKELDRNQLQNLVNVVGGVTIESNSKPSKSHHRRTTSIENPQAKFKTSLPDLKNLFASANLGSMPRTRVANKLNRAGFLTPNGLKFTAHDVTTLMAKHHLPRS